MSDMTKVARNLKKAMDDSGKRKPRAFDTEAEVVGSEGNSLWVKFPGGETSTPIRKTVDAKPGDKIMVRVSGHRAWAVGNETSPPTDDTVANGARSLAEDANRAANVAWEWADDAHRAADMAWEWADDAHAAASEAHVQANRALVQAERATGYANDALTQLGTVEEVVDTLNWVTEHGSMDLTTDTSIDPSHVYFKVDPDGVYVVGDTHYSLVSVPKEEELSTYYILSIDEAVSNYVATHIALTDSGLWVLYDDDANYRLTTDTTIDASKTYFVASSGGLYVPVITPKVEELGTYYERVETGDPTSGYKIRLGNDGMYVYDDHGHLVSTFGSNIVFDSDHEQYIGNDNAYIVFDPNGNSGRGSLIIGGSSIQMGNRSLDDVLGKTLIYDHSYEYVRDSNNKPVSANFTAFLYRGGVDVKAEYPTANFTWYLKKEEKRTGAVTETLIGTGYTCSVNLSTCGYGAEVIGKFTLADNAEALSTDGDNLTDVNNDNFTVLATGDSIRVRDLSVSTTIFPTDKIMVVGAEDEHLVSVQTLQDYLNANLTKQVLFDTTAGWSAQTSLVSDANTLYIYTDHQLDAQGNHVAGIKAGDGNAYVVDLPFTDAVMTEHIADTTIHITDLERTFWNNKVRCYHAGTENLIFTTT